MMITSSASTKGAVAASASAASSSGNNAEEVSASLKTELTLDLPGTVHSARTPPNALQEFCPNPSEAETVMLLVGSRGSF